MGTVVLEMPAPVIIPFDDGHELPNAATENPSGETVLVAFIQDRSGSMSDVWDETLNGFQVFLDELKSNNKENINYLISLTVFDTKIDTPLVATSINNVSKADLVPHWPRGGTALYDAVGATIRSLETNMHGASKVIVVITTDGAENSSREWKSGTLSKLVEDKTEAGWVFTYLGADSKAWDASHAIGISSANTMSYTAGMSSQRNIMVASSLKAFAEEKDRDVLRSANSQLYKFSSEVIGYTKEDFDVAGTEVKVDEDEANKLVQ